MGGDGTLAMSLFDQDDPYWYQGKYTAGNIIKRKNCHLIFEFQGLLTLTVLYNI